MTDTFRELCAEVLAFHHGEGRYNFSGLNPYDRDNAAFDAWQDIRQRLKSALAQPAPAPAVVPVAVSTWDNGFMGGICAALAVVKDHGDGVVWKEIVRSVGTDYALNYAANVNPEDWELAGFSTYAQSELGKGKPDPVPQAGGVGCHTPGTVQTVQEESHG
jgi:hypothetical protein